MTARENADELLAALRRALGAYSRKESWSGLIHNAQGTVASAANQWIVELQGIVRAAETTAHLSNRMVEFPRRNAERAAEMQTMLSAVRAAAQESAEEAKVVAAAAGEQLEAIESLSRGAMQLSASASQLAEATRFVRGADTA